MGPTIEFKIGYYFLFLCKVVCNCKQNFVLHDFMLLVYQININEGMTYLIYHSNFFFYSLFLTCTSKIWEEIFVFFFAEKQGDMAFLFFQ